MRILFIHNYYQQRGGEDAVFEEEVNLLREEGHIVETIEFTNQSFNGSVLCKLKNAIKSLYNYESIKQVNKVISNFKPNIVHIHNLFYVASPSVIITVKRWKIPVVMTLHNYRLVCNSGMLSRENEIPCERCLLKTIPLDGIKFGCFRNSKIQSAQLTAITSLHKLSGMWRKVDRYIVLTEFARKKVLQSSLNLRPEQVVVKPNSIPELGFTSSEERKDFFLYIGRLHYEKGVQSLVKAAYIHKCKIKIAGDGPLRPLIEKTVNELSHVNYMGYLSRSEGIKLIKQCKAIIIPSIWYEGLPTTILEAFATGTPVICSDQKNLNEIVINNETGILFKTGDAKHLAMTLSSFDKQKANKYASNAYKIYQNMYTKKHVIKAQVDIYNSLS